MFSLSSHIWAHAMEIVQCWHVDHFGGVERPNKLSAGWINTQACTSKQSEGLQEVGEDWHWGCGQKLWAIYSRQRELVQTMLRWVTGWDRGSWEKQMYFVVLYLKRKRKAKNIKLWSYRQRAAWLGSYISHTINQIKFFVFEDTHIFQNWNEHIHGNACSVFNMVYTFCFSLSFFCVSACLIACMYMYVNMSCFSVLYERTGRVCVQVISPNRKGTACESLGHERCIPLWLDMAVSQVSAKTSFEISVCDFCFYLSVWQHTLQWAKFLPVF